MLARRSVIALALSFLAAGCASSGSAPSDASLVVTDGGFVAIPLDLGTGAVAWEDIAPSAAHVKLIFGPQGGYHTLGRIRFSGFAPDVSVQFRVIDVATGRVLNDPSDTLRRRERAGLVRNGDQWESSSAELVIFTQIRNPSEVMGRTVRWEVTLEEAGTARRAFAVREFVVDYP
ncbi:MAG: hypothetical protein JNK05_04200 [Myxococcales bacterium]|nr:hypothetical protein [Myxococcales bacterium]